MTAQIAIMNRNAVALATDSAVTGVKVHNSANKLFTLSKYHPVGVMVHQNVEFMGYPWETLLKAYRRQLGKKSFETVAEYGEDFFRFLKNQDNLFPATLQEEWFRVNVGQYVAAINGDFVGKVRNYFDEHGKQLDDQGTNDLLEEFVTAKEQSIQSGDLVHSYIDGTQRQHFIAQATPIINEVVLDVFQKVPIAPFSHRLLQLILRRFMYDSAVAYTGIVFAGFGDQEFLPVVESYWVDGIFAGLLRRARYEGLSGNMNNSPVVRILPFAQSDTVFRFLQGVDPSFSREAGGFVDAMLGEILSEVSSTVNDLQSSEEARGAATDTLAAAATASRQRFVDKLENLKQVKFVQPVIDVIATLPKEDLAAIAESLVNLTSFQRKILREAETVGGPIDVAVISKGDGFIWIKRKHYFEKDLNPAFFANYYRGDGDNG